MIRHSRIDPHRLCHASAIRIAGSGGRVQPSAGKNFAAGEPPRRFTYRALPGTQPRVPSHAIRCGNRSEPSASGGLGSELIPRRRIDTTWQGVCQNLSPLRTRFLWKNLDASPVLSKARQRGPPVRLRHLRRVVWASARHGHVGCGQPSDAGAEGHSLPVKASWTRPRSPKSTSPS